MFDDYKICPYTGLRPFTEEESLYFKGRDEHIDQATAQLGKNKFLMLTGASGDGKSSLVYAGIIPNAKAGFLKSTYSNWAIADFRPERSPLYNFSKSLALQLGVENISTVQTELSHGYSSLVDLYKASDLFLDPDGYEWLNADDAQRKSMERNAANLLIVADQFEEFFTNPENYSNGVPSREANLVTNLLLETARIALEQNLPIYVIITMRSDFIGQCASFRGLPEYIGFSQFFVPRLNRKQLLEVIEEPAVLSGNKISRRLTERLIVDITEGTDQLPILQHALNQIWKMADEGSEEMDLIHYAMVGGMDGKELPDDSFLRFKQWFNEQSQKVKDCYDKPGLENVLNTHANKLYNLCYDTLLDSQKEGMTEDDAKIVIKTAFKCLTKIDNGRAVRNRMTLGEITSIINLDHVDFRKVGTVLGIYRETGNTLLKPYMEESPDLNEGSVLDITHESLIRNWDYLGHWAEEEFHHYTTFLDFEQQLNRWVKSGKSNAFLLYIGPLTYFENWFEEARPNTFWIARYRKDERSEEKYVKSGETLNNANEFLKRSAFKHIVTRTIMRYGPRRIAAVIAIIALIVLSSFMLKNYIEQQNSFMLNEIKDQTLALSRNPKVIFEEKVNLLNESLKAGLLSLSDITNELESPVEKVHLINGITAQLILQGKYEPKELIMECYQFSDSILGSIPVSLTSGMDLNRVMDEIIDFRTVLEIGYFYNPDESITRIIEMNADRSAEWATFILKEQPPAYTNISRLNLALENALNYRKLSGEQLQSVIYALSPIENENRTDWIKTQYHADKLLIRGSQSYGFKFNGLYHELAHLYAALGDYDRSLSCVDSLLAYNDNYYVNSYESNADNATNIIATFYLNGRIDAMHEFVKEYCRRTSQSPVNLYEALIGNSLPNDFLVNHVDLYDFTTASGNLNLQASRIEQRRFFYDAYRQTVEQYAKNRDERSFLLALSYKSQGITEIMQLDLGDRSYGKDLTSQYFGRALDLYAQVGEAFLKENITISITGAADFTTSRKFLFLYPDLRLPDQPLEPRSYYFYYYSGVFIDYLIDRGLFDTLYVSEAELRYFETWLREYHSMMFQPNYFMRKPVKKETLVKIERELAERNAVDLADLNLLYLYLGVSMGSENDPDSLLYCYRNIKSNNFNNLFNYRAYNNQINSYSFYLLTKFVTELARFGHDEEVHALVKALNNPVNRSSMYAFIAKELTFSGISKEKVRAYIDSSFSEIDKIQNLTTGQPNRTVLSFALALQNDKEDLQEAYRVIKNVPYKFVGFERITRSMAFHGLLFEAYENMPANISDTDISIFLWNILYGYSIFPENDRIPDAWNIYSGNYPWWQNRLIIFNNDIG